MGKLAVVVLLALSQMPATDQDRARAQIMIAEDGKRLTIRRPASDDLEVCVEPKDSIRLVCTTVRELRKRK